MVKTQIFIAGAGPYGLGLAAELQARGIDFRVCGHPFSLWKDHTLDSMTLRTDWLTSQIFGRGTRFSAEFFLRSHYPADWKRRLRANISIAEYRNYLDNVIHHLSFPVIPALVTQLEREGSLYRIQLDNGEQFQAPQVVLATGPGPHRYIPDALCTLPKDRVLHSWFSKSISKVSHSRIMVIGRGQSGGETAARLLQSENEVTWVVRHDPVFYAEPLNQSPALARILPSLTHWFHYLPRRFRQDILKRFLVPTISPLIQSQLQSERLSRLYEDVSDLDLELRNRKIYSREALESYDLVIAATGYNYHLDNLGFVTPEILSGISQEGGQPRLDHCFQTSLPGLFMIGGIAAYTEGPAQRYLMGAWNSTFRLGQRLAASAPAG